MPPDRDPFTYYRRLARLRRWTHLHLDHRITRDGAADVAGMSAAHFSRFFARATGECFSSWLARTRILEVERLLTSTNLNIVELADATGFGSPRTALST